MDLGRLVEGSCKAEPAEMATRCSMASSSIGQSLPQASNVQLGEEIRECWKKVRSNTDANMEMAMQERMQRQQEEELATVQKLAVVRKYAQEMAKTRGYPY